jgi:pSer/pThr/pTyr-binding forkhead associated (FHA) protein
MLQGALLIESTFGLNSVGQMTMITHTPFTLGRKQRDLNFDGDDNVSWAHAEIFYENGAFFIRDNNSTHGTYVDERQAPPGKAVPLYDGAAIRLGTTTILRFVIPQLMEDMDDTHKEMG